MALSKSKVMVNILLQSQVQVGIPTEALSLKSLLRKVLQIFVVVLLKDAVM